MSSKSFAKKEDEFIDRAAIVDCTVLASYNWVLSAPDATILVPGQPPRWTPLKPAVRLSEDSGEYFRDRNAARFPKHPMEPAVRAALDAVPALRADKPVDVVACSSTLGNLLRFVKGQDKPFRMLVEEVDGTVFLIRRENSPTELIPGVRGFGHSFPEAYTTWDSPVRGSTSHQRILHYGLGGLKLLVRFEADGYIDGGNNITTPGKPECQPAASRETIPSLDESSVEDLARVMGAAGVRTNETSTNTNLRIRSAGRMVDQSLVFDLKTRSINKKEEDTLGDVLPRLWIARVDNFILAHHRRGRFDDIKVMDVRGEVRDWEEHNKNEIARLAATVHRIIELVREQPTRKLELRLSEADVLEVRKQADDAGDALSPATKAMWIASSKKVAGDVIGPSKEEIPTKGSTSDEGPNTFEWVDDSGENFTDCSASCGYCGRCEG